MIRRWRILNDVSMKKMVWGGACLMIGRLMFTLFHQNHETTLFCECYFLLVDKVALFHHNHETTPCCET